MTWSLPHLRQSEFTQRVFGGPSWHSVVFQSWLEAVNCLLCSVHEVEGEPGPAPVLPELWTPQPQPATSRESGWQVPVGLSLRDL